MRHLALGIAMLWPLAVVPARAQGTPDRLDERMRAEVEQRFADRVRSELQLTDEQATRVRATAKDYGARRKELRDHERALRAALADQLRPSTVALDDSVARLTDDLVDLRVTYMETYRKELKDLGTFLTPIQRARLIILREQLVRAARAARDDRSRLQARERVARPKSR